MQDQDPRKKFEKLMEGRHRSRARHQPSPIPLARKALMTTAIGALARFEKAFGELWGHGKDEISEEEGVWDDRWEECRTQILDHVHDQISNLEENLN